MEKPPKNIMISIRIPQFLHEIVASKSKAEEKSVSKTVRDILNVYFNTDSIQKLEKIYNSKKKEIVELKEFLSGIREAINKTLWLSNNIASSVNQIAHSYNVNSKLKKDEEKKLSKTLEEYNEKEYELAKEFKNLNLILHTTIVGFIDKILVKEL